MEAELGLKERELELEAINAGVDTKDFAYLSKEVDNLTSKPGMIKIDNRNMPINSNTQALLPLEYRRQLGAIKNYALKLLQQAGGIDNFIAQDGLNAVNEEIYRIYREGFSQLDPKELDSAGATQTKASAI
jgi:hypothetical protein